MSVRSNELGADAGLVAAPECVGVAIEDNAVSLRALVGALRARVAWGLAVAAVCLAAGIAVALLMTPIYRASVVVVPVSADRVAGGLSNTIGQFGGLASLAGLSLDSRDINSEEALAVLRSRQFLGAFIADHDLLPRLFPRRWDASRRAWKEPVGREPTAARGVKFFNERLLTVGRDKKTGLVTVSVDWIDRVEAAAWANELIARVNVEMRNRATANAVASIAYLERERESTQFVETRDAINRLIEAQIKQRMLATVTQEYAFRTVDRALPPDSDDLLRPKRVFLVATGALGGAALGVIVALLVAAFKGDFQRARTLRHAQYSP